MHLVPNLGSQRVAFECIAALHSVFETALNCNSYLGYRNQHSNDQKDWEDNYAERSESTRSLKELQNTPTNRTNHNAAWCCLCWSRTFAISLNRQDNSRLRAEVTRQGLFREIKKRNHRISGGSEGLELKIWTCLPKERKYGGKYGKKKGKTGDCRACHARPDKSSEVVLSRVEAASK